MQTLLLLITLLANSVLPANCDDEFIKTYQLAAKWVYPRNTSIGPLLPLDAHKCDGWLPGYLYPGKVAVRPLYSDSGLPLYDIFEDEWEVLEGFEFRIMHMITHTCTITSIEKGNETWECRENYFEYWNGYSVALTARERMIYAILKF